jgi:hypothetical protein
MRHVPASAPLAGGATPAVMQRQLRHSDPRITLGIYGHVVGNQQLGAVEALTSHPEASAGGVREASVKRVGALWIENSIYFRKS